MHLKKSIKNNMLLAGLLLEFAFALLGGAVIGYFLDKWLGTKPWLTVACLIIAGLASIRILVIIISRAKRSMEDEPD